MHMCSSGNHRAPSRQCLTSCAPHNPQHLVLALALVTLPDRPTRAPSSHLPPPTSIECWPIRSGHRAQPANPCPEPSSTAPTSAWPCIESNECIASALNLDFSGPPPSAMCDYPRRCRQAALAKTDSDKSDGVLRRHGSLARQWHPVVVSGRTSERAARLTRAQDRAVPRRRQRLQSAVAIRAQR